MFLFSIWYEVSFPSSRGENRFSLQGQKLFKSERTFLACDTAIPLPGADPRRGETHVHTDVCPWTVTAALFTKANERKQRQGPWPGDRGGLSMQWNIIWPEKEGSTDSCYNTETPWKHAKGRKPDTEYHTMCRSINRKCAEEANLLWQSSLTVGREREREGGWGEAAEEYGVPLWGAGMFRNSGVVEQLCGYIKNH